MKEKCIIFSLVTLNRGNTRDKTMAWNLLNAAGFVPVAFYMKMPPSVRAQYE